MVDSGAGKLWQFLDYSITSYVPDNRQFTVTFGECPDWDCVAQFMGTPMPPEDTLWSFIPVFTSALTGEYSGDNEPAEFQPDLFTDPPIPTPEPSTFALLLIGLVVLIACHACYPRMRSVRAGRACRN